jgi:hypothetical protein
MLEKKRLIFRPIGKGFIVRRDQYDTLNGRSLTMAYVDQNDRTYVKVSGQMKLLKTKHCFLSVD